MSDGMEGSGGAGAGSGSGVEASEASEAEIKKFLSADRRMSRFWASKSNDWCTDKDLKRFIRAFWRAVQTLPCVAAFSRDLHVAAPWLKIGPFAGVREAAIVMTLELSAASHPRLWAFCPTFVGGGGEPVGDGSLFQSEFEAFFEANASTIMETALKHGRAYQMNIPQRLTITALGVAVATQDWDDTPAAHIDLGTASGVGTLVSLGRFEYVCHPKTVPSLVLQSPPCESSDAPAAPVISMRGVFDTKGSVPSFTDVFPFLRLPPVARRLGVDLHPVDLDNDEEVLWHRASQMWVSRRAFDEALDCLRKAPPTVLGGDAVDGLLALERDLPPGMPLIVTDTIVSVYFRRPLLESLWSALDDIATRRRLVWVSFNQPTPMGPRAKTLTTGDPIPGHHEKRLSKAFLTVKRWTSRTGTSGGGGGGAGDGGVPTSETTILGHAEVVGQLHFTWTFSDEEKSRRGETAEDRESKT